MRVRNFAGRSSDSPAPAPGGPPGGPTTGSDDDDAMTSQLLSEPPPARLELITELRNFIAVGASVDGQARTQEVLTEFGARLPPSDSATFKAILKQLCTLHKDTGVRVWYLKPHFR